MKLVCLKLVWLKFVNLLEQVREGDYWALKQKMICVHQRPIWDNSGNKIRNKYFHIELCVLSKGTQVYISPGYTKAYKNCIIIVLMAKQ